MILNLLNNILALCFGVGYGFFYFLTKEINSSSDIFFGILFSLIALVLTWIVLFILIWLFFLLPALTINPKKEYKKINKFYYFMLNYWYSYILSFLRVKIKVTGINQLPKNMRYLSVCNHRSNIDNMVQNAILKKEKLCFIAKKEIFEIPFANHYMTRSLYLKLDRKDIKQSLQQILKAISYIKNDIISVGVFPEGKRSKNGSLLEFNPGCFKIAEKTHCPIVIFTIENSEKVRTNFPFKKTVVNLSLIKVLQPEDYKDKNSVDISNEVHSLIKEKLGQ